MEQFQGPGACLVVEPIIREGIDDASQEKGQSCLFVLERYPERSSLREHLGDKRGQKRPVKAYYQHNALSRQQDVQNKGIRYDEGTTH